MQIIHSDLDSILISLADESDKIRIAVAFLTDTDVLTYFLNTKNTIELIVSLRPPTNPKALRKIYQKTNTRFLGTDFHSKIYCFYENDELKTCVIGSSNFTNGGLINNIETNVLIDDITVLKQVEEHFSDLWTKSKTLQPSDIDKLEKLIKEFNEANKIINKKLVEHQENINQRSKIKSKKVSKVAQEYLQFWKSVDDVKYILSNELNDNYPNVPPYLVIDLFWDWLKEVGIPQNAKFNSKRRQLYLPVLFNEFIESDVYSEAAENRNADSDSFRNYLSESKIDRLSRGRARDIYVKLNSGRSRAQRFGSHLKFANDNDINKIRKSLKYLLYNEDDVELRIHNLLDKNGIYKLSEFGDSCVQELLGWIHPKKYPCRNEKANDGIKYLGYKL